MSRGKGSPEGRAGRRTPALEDWHLWSEVKKTVDPLKSRLARAPLDREGLERALNPASPAAPPAPPPRPARLMGPAGPSVPASPAFDRMLEAPASSMALEPGLRRRLKSGRLTLDATLDLHGMTQQAAHEALLRFIFARAGRGDRTLLVITGKGLKKTGYLQIAERGVLRHAVPRWLAAPPFSDLVAGVEAAHTGHGGQGALYVRLKSENRRRR